jgi:hypothetical protein
MPAFLYLPNGMRGEIRCPVDANPPITQVLWTKNNHKVNVMTSPKLAIDSNWTLIFSAVEERDAGRYTCTPYSVLGTGNTSPVVQVFVKGVCSVLLLVLISILYSTWKRVATPKKTVVPVYRTLLWISQVKAFTTNLLCICAERYCENTWEKMAVNCNSFQSLFVVNSINLWRSNFQILRFSQFVQMIIIKNCPTGP